MRFNKLIQWWASQADFREEIQDRRCGKLICSMHTSILMRAQILAVGPSNMSANFTRSLTGAPSERSGCTTHPVTLHQACWAKIQNQDRNSCLGDRGWYEDELL